MRLASSLTSPYKFRKIPTLIEFKTLQMLVFRIALLGHAWGDYTAQLNGSLNVRITNIICGVTP